MPNPNDNRKWLYDKLTEKGVKMGTYEQFDKAIDDENNLKWVYDKASSQGLKVGDYNQFSGALKRVAAEAPATAEKPVAETVQPAETATQAAPEAPATEKVEEKPATKPATPPKKPTLTDSYKVPEINTPFTQPERPDVPVPFAPETPVNSTVVKNTDEKAAAELREQTERDVQRYGTGNADYTFEEAVSAGREYEKIAPEIAKYDERLKAFKDKYGPMEEIVKEVNEGKRKLTQEEYRKLQAQYPGYDKEAKALSELGKSYDAILATAPGREYQAVSKRMDEIGKGAKTPEAVLEYAQEFSKLQRNPLYRAQLGENAPSEDEIQSDWLQAQIAYFDEKMKTATGDEKKELKKAFSDAKEALYANPYYRKHLEGKVAENKEVSTIIGEELAKRRNELTAEWTARNGGAPDAWSAQGFEQWVQGDQEMKNLYAAAHMVDDAIREYQKPTKYDDSKGLRNVGKGLADWAGNTDTWSFGIEQFAEDIGVVRPILEKVEKLAGSLDLEHLTDSAMDELEKQLTQGEQAVLLGYFEKIMAVAAKGADTSIGYQIGQGIGDMVNLGVEMALTGPVGGAARKGIDKAGMAAMKKLLTKRMYRQFAKSGVGRVALWTGHKAVRDVAETLVRIPFMPSTYKAIGEGAVELSSDYKTRDFMEYAPEKAFDNFVEQLTEVSNGFAFPLMGKVMKMRGMKNFVTSVIGKDSAKALRTFIERGDIKLLDDMMIGSFGGEWEEELLGAVIHSVTDDPNALRDFFSAEQQLVLLGTLAPIPLARGTVGGVQLAVPAAQAALAWNKAESELKRLGFDEGRIARLKEVVDNASAPEGARAIMQAMKDAGFSRSTAEGQGFLDAAGSPENDVLYGSVPEIDRDAYDALAHYYWRAQQKRAAGLMGEVENDKKVRDKRAELKSKYGQFWHNEMGEEVVETGTIIGADGNPLNVFIASDEPMEDGRVAYVGEDGSNGFLSRDQLVGQNADGTFAPNPETTVTPINIYLAGLVMQDSQVQEAQGVVNEASAANTSLRDQIEGLADVKYKGQSGTITRADDNGAIFVPDDGENVRVTWAELAAENGIQEPEVKTPTERTGDAAALVAEHTRLKQELAGAFRQASDEAGKNGRGALLETDEGTATVVNIISDTIDPENGTAQFTVRMPDGSMNVTMATAIEPVMSQLRGESAPEPEPEPAPAPAPAPGPQPPAGGAGGAELDFRGNQIPMKDGQVDEEAFREKDPEAWAAWNDALPEDDPRKATLGTKKRLEGLAKSAKSAADKAQKDLEKLYDKGATDKEIREKETEIRDQRARQKRYEDALGNIGKRELDKAEAEREAARKAAEAERLRREKEKEEEEKRKAGKAPDISEDTPEAAQKRGYIMVNGNRIDRPTPDAVAEKGKDTKIAFTKSVAVDGKYGLVEATRIEPSHISDQENPLHFFAKKWQPKNRKRADSAVAIQQMANGIRPGEITRGETAYGGAPIVNERGEVIQGNGRSEALRRAYGQGTAAEYKAWLAEHAEEFGLTREQVEKMETPILVRVLDVDDARAEQLGKMEQKDLESGGDQRFNGKTLVKKMGRRFGEFLDYLFAGDLGDDATALDYINQNGYTALHWLHQNGFINDTEYANAQENGKLTEETISAFRAMSIEPLFDNVPEKVRSGFEMLPNSVKLALQRSVATLYGLEGVIGDIQDALAYYCDFETADPVFKKAKNTAEAWNAVAAWMQNVRFDGTSEGEAHPSIVARRFASIFKGGVLVEGEKNPKRTEKAFRSLFTNIASTMRGEGGFMSAAEPTDNIGAYRENNVITEEEENQIRNGKNDNRPGPASGSGANGPVGGQGSGAVRGGRPGGVPERKPAGEGAGPVAPETPANQAPETPAGFGANNKLFTKDARDKAREIMLRKLKGQLNAGIDPEMLTAMIQYCGYYIEAGVRTFVEFAKTAIVDLGDAIRPYLKSMYTAVRHYPGMEEYAKEMTPYDEVEKVDVDTIGKEEEPVEEPAEEPAPAAEEKPEESKENSSESPEKSVTSQEENLEQGSLFGEPEPAPEEKTPVKVAVKKEQGNGLQGNDGSVLPEGLPTDNRGPEGQPGEGSQRAGEGEGSEAGGTDGRGQRDRAGDVRPDQHRPDDSVKKNTRNNRVSRGETVYPKTPAARYRANLAAIRLLKKIEQEGREATKEEMEVLRKFTGWGGLGAFFNNRRSLEYREISEVLTTDEIQAAENSINTAYYTPVEVIDAMWDIAKKLGFKGGRVLEGSAGIGNILASMPEAISNRSDIQAVELDPITGGILRLLYPDASVLIDGFENADIPNNSVDLAITNVPFGDDIRVYDEKEKDLTRKFGGRIHDFCIAKNIRKLKEGGIAIFITSRSTLDSASKTLRNWIVNEGGSDVIGVFRLNNDTFEGTGATSDIIVVRKRVNGEVSPDAINIQDTSIVRRETYETTDRNNETTEAKAAMEINDYFAEHPENMGGEMAFGFEKGDSYRPGSSALWPADGVSQSERLEKWVSGFRQQVQIAKRETAEEPEQANAKKEGQLVLNSKGKLCISRRGQAVPLEVNDSKVAGYTKAQVVKDYDAIKTALDAALRYQLDNATDEGLAPLLRKLNSAYDTFVSRYGYLNKNRSIPFLRNDVDFPSIAALESYREKKDITGKVTVSVSKTPVFSGRVLGQKTTPTPKDVRDGVIVSMTQFGRIDIPFIAKALGRDEESVRKEALKSGLCFENPENGTVEVEYEYLSGNVREKLAYAESHNEDGKYDANIKALKEVIPRDIPAHLIEFSLGSDWLPVSLYVEYAKEKFGVNNDFVPQHFGGSWGIANEYYAQRNDKNIAGGVRSEKLGIVKTGVDLMLAAMNKQTVKFSIVIKEPDGSKRTETDKDASQAAATKIDEMRDDFKEWCRKRMLNDRELSDSIAKTYNETFNAIAPKRISEIFSPEHFEGQVETMGGKPFHLYPHQSQAVVRATTQPLMMAHEVGTGKTFTLITTAMEMRRLGTAKKPMIVVQNATLGQFVSSAKALYPNAKILTISEKDRTREGRSEFYAKIKYNDWDMIIVPQSVFEMIPDSEKRKRDYIEAKIDEARHILAQATEAKNAAAKKRLEEEIKDLEYERDFGEKRPKKNSERDAKREAKVKNNAKARAQQQLDRKTDEVSDFDDMGIDALLVDEAHNYKRLGFSTSMAQGVKGVDPAYSKKSAGVYLKTRAVFDKAGWKNVVFATGTPISNTAAEIWTFMRYMMPDEMMRELHIYYFDDFVSNFGNISQSLEFTTSGKFKENSRFASYTNLPELIRIWSSVTDTVLTKDAVAAKADAGEEAEKLDDKVPVMENWTDDKGEVHENQARDIYLPQSPSLVRIMNAVRARLEWYESLTGKEKRQNSSVPLVMYGLAKMAAIDPRLVDRNATDEPQSKTNKAVEETLRALKDSERYKGTCALFSDNFRRVEKTADGKTVEAFNLFEEIKRKLVAAGVPEDQIVIIKNGMSVPAKEKIFAAVNAGDVRVIMGTTASLGTGVNIQERLFFEAHLDAPNRPMDYTQRMGRILRQGNLHKQWGIPVRVVRFGVEDSLDVTAYQRLSTKSKFINSIMDGRPLIENGMENRILEEEEEGVFDNPVAVLSGSQYAMLKSAAERELRKLRSKKEQHRQDQIYIESNLRYNEGAIKNIKDRIKESEKLLAAIEEKFPDGKISEIVIEGKKVSTDEEIAAALKEKIFDPLKVAAEQRKKYAESSAYERNVEDNKEFTIKVNGVLVRVLANIAPESDWRTGKVSVSTTVRYQAREIGIDEFSARRMPNGINGVKEIINDFRDNVASGKLQRENIESYNERIAKLEADNESMSARRGKPFADEEKLAEQEKLVEELTQKMKDEMAAKEAKYASQAAGIDGSTFDLDAASESTEEEDSEEGDLYRTSDEIAEEYPNWMDDQTSTEVEGSQRGQNTQVAGTVGTYKKVGDWIESNLGKDTKVLDASSGLGLGTLELRERGFDVEDIEPYPGRGRKEQPTYGGEDAYQQAVDDGKEYDFIISNAVLNVIPDDWRAGVLHNMARLLKPGGRMFINTRKAGEERTIKNKIELDSPQEVLVGTPERINSYQRFFTPAELKEYVERELGDGYTVEIANKRNSGTSGLAAVVVTKKTDGERNRRGENLRNPIDRAAAIVKINEIANKLGVKFEEDPDLKAKGVFSPKTGKIRINIDAHKNTADLEATLLHESVAHYGLRKLFGKDWKELRMRLYEQASPEIKARVDAIAKADGLSTEVAMEEYIAQLAEDGRFDEQEESFWQKIVTALKRLLAKIGFNSGYLTDEDFRAMLYASYRNLQTGGALETAARVATAAALRRNAEASHEDNGPEDNGPGGGLPADTEEDMMGRGNDEVVREVSADLYDRYENQNGEDKPWMSENELIDRIEEELPYGIETKELFARIDEYRRLDEEDFNEGRRDFSGSERDNVFREIMAELERLSKERPVRLAVSDSSVSREKNEIKAMAQANGSFMKAPNGQPTNLTEDQWLTVRTKAFKDWFGDWENDPANASKVVDENGEPLVVYRVERWEGDVADYTVFDENKGGNWRGFYFTNRDAALKNYGDESTLRAFFLDSKNPFTENNFNILQGDKQELIDMGHDGMIFAPDGIKARNFEVKVFEPNQIKSATDNNGNFSTEDPDIYHRELSDLPESEREQAEDMEIDQDSEEYYRRDRGYSEAKTADDMYDRKTSTVGSALYTAQVDEYAPLDAFQQAISAEAKKELSENERVSNRLRELGGQAMNEVRTYNEKFLQPMWKAIADLRKAVRGADGGKLSMQELTRYVGLKSGLERNELFAKRDAKKDAKSYYDKEYDNRKAELTTRETEEKARLKARLDEGIISDVTYQGELNALAVRIQQLKDKAEADHQANVDNVDKETASEYRRLYGEYRQKDYSGLLSWFTEEADLKRSDYPSRKAYQRAVNAARKNYVPGVTDLASAEAMAKRIVDDIESRAGSHTIGNLWNRINAATKETLDFQYRKNMISRQQRADISASMRYYIPMRGFEDATAEDLYSYYMKPNVSGFAPTILAAQGRHTRYRSPFGMIGFMHSSAVSQGLKNEAKLELLDFVRRNPKNTVATVTRAWFVKTGETDADGKPIYEVAYPQVPEGATVDEREHIIEDFETDMKERKERGEAYNAHREVQMNGGVVAFEKDAHRTEHIVRVMEGGREYGIVINGNPAAAQAVNGIKRQGGYENFLEIMRATRRVLSQMFTTLSIPFWVSNFQRDHGQGGINTFVRNNLGYVGKYIINRWELLPQMIPLVLSRAEQGSFIDRLSPKFADYYRLYLENGGPMGQNRIETDVTFNRQLERYLRTQQHDKAYIANGAHALARLLSAIGEGVETVTRFATFVTSMEYGRPLHEAIADSKEVSTNFARKGHGRSISWEETGRMETRSGRQLGDTSGSAFETYRNYVDRALIVSSSAVLELLRAGIPFFNAAIQGIKNKTDNYRKNWVKALLADGTYFAIGFAMRYLMGGAGGDDDKEKYGHTSDYTRRNNFLTPLGEGRYHKWALSQEYRYMYALGDITAEALLQEKPYDDLALDAFEALVQVLPAGAVDPSARGEAFWIDAIKSVLPGVVTPIVEAFENKDFKGSRIYDEGFNGNKTDYPGWTKAIDTTGPGYVKAAEWLNQVSGGGEENATVRGSIDFNPAIVEHFVKSYLSGPYQIVGGVGTIVGKKMRGEEIATRDIPVLNRVLMNTNDNSRDAYYSGLYYYFKDRDKEARRLDTGMRGHQTQQAKDFRKSKDYAYMLIFKKYESNERELNQMKKAAQNAGNEDAVKKVELKTTGIRENIAKECLDVYFDRVDWKSWLEKTNSGNEN